MKTFVEADTGHRHELRQGVSDDCPKIRGNPPPRCRVRHHRLFADVALTLQRVFAVQMKHESIRTFDDFLVMLVGVVLHVLDLLIRCREPLLSIDSEFLSAPAFLFRMPRRFASSPCPRRSRVAAQDRLRSNRW